MFIKQLFISALFLLGFNSVVMAQDDFCEAVTTILRDAPKEFRNVRTNLTQTSVGAQVYKCGVNVPGTMSSRFVYTMGNFYEGALAQSKTIAAIKAPYEKYKKMLEECLAPMGLKMKLNDNFYPGLSDYKKVVYLPEFNKSVDIKSLKGHASLEVDYNKNSGLYTLIFYIYQH